jgi:hypothetical protein
LAASGDVTDGECAIAIVAKLSPAAAGADQAPSLKHSSVFLAAVDECDRGSTRASSTVPSHRLRDRIHAKGGFSDRTQPATPQHGERLPHPGGWSALRTSSMPPTGGDQGRHAILGVGADHHESPSHPWTDSPFTCTGGSRSKSASSFPAAPDRLELALRANWPSTLAVAHRLGTRICARAPLRKRCSSTTSSFRCSSSLANGLWPAPIAIGIVDR